jgi:hypothetical protein
MASPALNTFSLSREAALMSEAAMTAVMSQAFLAILEPERQGLVDSGVSQVTKGLGRQTKGWILDGS